MLPPTQRGRAVARGRALATCSAASLVRDAEPGRQDAEPGQGLAALPPRQRPDQLLHNGRWARMTSGLICSAASSALVASASRRAMACACAACSR